MSKISTILGGALLCIALTGCENFLTGDEAKDNIKREIDYANAPSYTIYVVADRDCGQIRKPITGELKKKVTDTFDLKFEPADDYTFVRWEASSEELPEGANIKDYITFEEQGNPETKATFIKALDSIVITAVCPHLPSFDYTITGSNGKFSPSKGTYTCTQSYNYQLAFEPDTDYEFIKWEIYDSVSGDAIPNGLYLEIADLRNENTTIVLNQAPADPDLKITVRPVVTERPQILSNSPLYNSEGVYKDSRIQIVFDYDIDESCIYYTEEEMRTMLADKTADQGLFQETKDGDTVYYGYKKNNKTFFKNILIKDNQKGTNYNDKFKHPEFKSPRILTISTDSKHPLPDFAEVLVTAEKNFSYTLDNKPVSLAGNKKWIYLTNKKTDDISPQVVNPDTEFRVGLSDGTEITATTTLPTTTPSGITNYLNHSNNELYLKLKINDTGSGPANTCQLLLDRIADQNYDSSSESITKTIDLKIDDTDRQSAFYNDSSAGGYVDLSDIPDGVYGLKFKFFDKNERSTTYPAEENLKYYFTKDPTKPAMAAPSLSEPYVIGNGSISYITNKLNFSWTPCADLKKTLIEYKLKSENTYTNSETVTSDQGNAVTINNLQAGNDYDFKITYTDYNNNETVNEIEKTLRSLPPQNIRCTSYRYGFLTIQWDPPAGTFEKYEIQYDDHKPSSSGTFIRTVNVEKTATEKELSVQAWGFPLRRTFKISTLNSKNQKSNEVEFSTYTGFIPSCYPMQSGTALKLRIVLDNVEKATGLTYTLEKRSSNSNNYVYAADLQHGGGYYTLTETGCSYRVKAEFQADGKNYIIYSEECFKN